MTLSWVAVDQTRAHYHSSYTWTWLFVSDVPATDWQDTIVFGDKAVILEYSDATDHLANFTEVCLRTVATCMYQRYIIMCEIFLQR